MDRAGAQCIACRESRDSGRRCRATIRGVDIIDLNHLINLVSMSAVGQTADVIVWRDGASTN